MPGQDLKLAFGPRQERLSRRWMALVAAGAILGACESAAPPPLGTVGHVQGFQGRLAADEPYSVQVGQEVLSAGGTAADAAVAMYFSTAVTLPSRASLGGGGVCVVHDNPTQQTEVLEFVPRVSADGAAGNPVPVAVPGNPRGMFALHSRFGRLLWEQLLAPAERLARDGHTVSKPLAQDLLIAARLLLKDPESSQVFARDGEILREGDVLSQPDLGVLLSELRTRGPGEFYEGMLAPALVRRFAEAAGTTDGAVTIDDLRDYQPEWRDSVSVAYGEDLHLHFAPAPAAAGPVAAQMWVMLGLDERYKETPEEERGHLFAEVSMRAFADRGRWLDASGESIVSGEEVASEERARELMASFDPEQHTAAQDLTPAPVAFPENPAATSFVVVDREGSAVACVYTMNNLFGLGRTVRDAGIVLAMAPAKGSGTTALLPMLMVNESTGEFLFAAAASGGAAAPTALTTVAAQTLIGEEGLENAIDAKRLHHSGLPDTVLHEAGESEERLLALTTRGHSVFEIESLGLVNAVYCPKGLPGNGSSCEAWTDPRGSGSVLDTDD
jgi:gamma-glutamyltranspeptidase/glutathione hydrolase